MPGALPAALLAWVSVLGLCRGSGAPGPRWKDAGAPPTALSKPGGDAVLSSSPASSLEEEGEAPRERGRLGPGAGGAASPAWLVPPEPPEPRHADSSHSARPLGEGSAAPVCAYQVSGAGPGAAGGGRLCFRQPERRFRCRERECRAYRSQGPGGLVANVLSNGSVLVQWGGPGSEGRRRGGFLLSCSWNGSYTQFQCDRVRLGASCRDYLLTEAHEGVRYHVCLQALGPPAGPPDCLDFTLLPSGMQDIVIAMTAVGGAICVMLVIICLLVAYITENLMNPASTHPRAQAH
ncbi:fibronectin type III domain-containing protein 10 [Lepisosteus oculatus]|uniref:fibronectin type III domain-containing protein 10 n=1 Tax=Lepisosteus oculatus TaxID=7918 RepID=UPI00371F12AA